jgi:ATP-dependent helicase HrpA
VPFWQSYLTKRAELLAKSRPFGELEDFGWLVEEQRVAVFAPELKTAVPVSTQRLQELWQRVGKL